MLGIKKVSVYLSDFGAEKIKIEKSTGPSDVIAKITQKLKDQGVDTESRNTQELVKNLISRDPLLRQYELERLRYYYAVLEFHETAGADWIYSHCDGLEFEKSGMKFDLRGVPEDLVIPKEPEQICTQKKTFSKTFLKKKRIKNVSKSHTNVDLTWDSSKSFLEYNWKIFEFIFLYNVT